MNIISFIAQKGGTAKTTSALNIGTALARQGFSVLFVDLDEQRNLTGTLTPSAGDQGTVLDVLQQKTDLQSAAIITPAGDLLQADPGIGSYDPDPEELADMLKAAAGKYDYCIIDNPTQVTTRTAASIYAADYIVIPTNADKFGIDAAMQLINTVDTIRATTGHAGRVVGVLLTLYNGQTVLARQAREYLQKATKEAGTALFNTVIRNCNAVKEAIAAGEDLYTYAPRSNGAADYRAATAELLERMNEKPTAGRKGQRKHGKQYFTD